MMIRSIGLEPFIVLVTFCLISVPTFTLAQNLVNNSGFEETLADPQSSPSGVGEAPFWTKLEGTTDFFHADYQHPHGIPDNWRGTQDPLEGKGYAGIISTANPEFLVMRLKEPLIADQIYDLSFHVNLSEQSSHGIDGLGGAVMID